MLWHSSSESVPNTDERSLRAVLSCFLIILRKIDLENVCPSVTWNLMGFCLHIGLRWQISCGRFWEYATSKWNAIIWKRKNFFSIFCCIYLIYIKFRTFWKKRWSSWVIYFRNYRMWKSLLKNSLKGTVSEQALEVNMWKCPKCLQNLHETVLIMFFIIVTEVDLENVSPSVRWNLRGVFEYIDIRWQVSCSGLWEFATENFNAIIWKTKTFSQILFHFWNLHQILNILKKRWFS